MHGPWSGDDEPLGWFTRVSLGTDDGVGETNSRHARAFEFSSRGDRVTGTLLCAAGEGRFPLVLIADPRARADAATPPLCDDLVARGCSVARVDLPLYGARAEHKLAACVEAGWSGEGPMASLARSWATQACVDLRRCLDALLAEETIDPGRVAFIGVAEGADAGALYCADDPRPRAAVLAALTARPAAPDLDPRTACERFAPRPLLALDAPPSMGSRGEFDQAALPFLCEALGL